MSSNNDDTDKTHKLIIGDNYDALQQLLITHKGMIDVIYIDPPYGSDSMGNFAKTNYTNAITRDNLLSMLYPRMILAKQLLSEEGIIFCSIDDKNQAYVKGLFDEIFGENNFGVNIIVNRPSEIASTFSVSKHEYMLMYSKNVDIFTNMDKEKTRYVVSRGTIGNENQSQPIIEFPSGLNCYGIADGVYKETRKIDGSKENIENLDEIVVENGKLKNPVRLKARWRASKDMRNFFDNNCQPTRAKISGDIVEIYFDNDRFIPQIKKASSDKISSLFLENKKGSNELSDLNLIFDFPKSTYLIKEILKQAGIGKECIVLDFFAGSGTTGQAVLELNKEDGGSRQFILCTNNEKEDGYIAETVTSKRLKRIMTGSCYDGNTDFKWIKKNEPYGNSLDVFEIATVNNTEQSNGKSPFDVIDETCYDMPKFVSVHEKIAWVCNNFENTQKYIKEEE